jgi:uncharacterized protein (TIGR02246 family)
MLSRFAVFVPAIVLAAACSGSPEVPTAGDTAPIDDVRNRYIAGYNAGDAAAVAALFAEDAISMPDHHATLEGRAAIESYLRDLFMQYSASTTITPGETEVIGDIAHEHGSFTVTLTPKAGGTAMTETGKYLVILKKGSDGTWLLHHDIDNSNVPPPAPAPSQPGSK